jgi:rRNA small subunit pseudouridine methyltransferase Nep1
MVQLLHKLSIRAVGTNEKLLNIIKNPITDHLPTKCQKVGMSGDAEVVKLGEWVKQLPENESVVFWVGGMAHGKDEFPLAESVIGISEYPLSASVVCAKICSAFEDLWGIL